MRGDETHQRKYSRAEGTGGCNRIEGGWGGKKKKVGGCDTSKKERTRIFKRTVDREGNTAYRIFEEALEEN